MNQRSENSPKISGFSLVRNGDRFDYPYLESFRSMLPLVDELIINVGMGDDSTIQKVQNFAETEGHGKVRFFESDWNLNCPEKQRAGLILSEQTNLALDQCNFDWCLYLQADEVLHQQDFSQIRQVLNQCHSRPEVEGLLFDYRHFYGSFDVIQNSRSTYRREVRMIRKSSQGRSLGDAQSFRKKDGTKLKVIHSQARVFHYGWVRSPDAMKEKTYFMDQLYHGKPKPENAVQGIPHTGDNYRYKKFWGLQRYLGDHPSVMHERIESKGWHWDLDSSPWVIHWSDVKKIILDTFEKLTGYRLFEYKSYQILPGQKRRLTK